MFRASIPRLLCHTAVVRVFVYRALICTVSLALLLTPSETTSQPKPGNDSAARLDAFGDPLPTGAVARWGSVRLRHPTTIQHVVFSPDNKTIASLGNYQLCLWDVKTGKQLLFIRDQGPISAFTFSSDGTQLVFGLLAYSKTKIETLVVFWDIARNKEVRRLANSHQGYIVALALSRNGKTLVTTGGDGKVCLWDADNLKALRSLDHREGAACVEFTADDMTLLTGGYDGKIRAWNPEEGVLKWQVDSGERTVGSIRVTDEKKFMCGKRIYRIADGEVLRTFPVKGAISHDCKTLAYSGRGSVLWNLETDHKQTLESIPFVTPMVFSPDNSMVVFVDVARILIFDRATGKILHPWSLQQQPAGVFVFGPDQKTVIARTSTRRSYQDDIVFYNFNTGKVEREIPCGKVTSLALDLSPDGKTLAYNAGKSLFLYDMAAAKNVFEMDMGRPDGGTLKFSPDGKFLAGIPIREGLLELKSRTATRRLINVAGWRDLVVAFSSDGKRLAGTPAITGAGTIALVDISSDVPLGMGISGSVALGILQRHRDASTIGHLGFFGQGHYLIDGQYIRHCYWNLSSQRIVHEDEGTQKKTEKGPFAISGNVMMLAKVDEDNRIVLVDLVTGKNIAAFARSDSPVSRLVFSPEGLWLGSGHRDETLLIWDWRKQLVNGCKEMTPEALLACLSQVDPALSYGTLGALIEKGEANVEIVSKLVPPANSASTKRCRDLIGQLESEKDREKAITLLRKDLKSAEFVIRDACAEATLSKEAKQILKNLLAEMPPFFTDPALIARLRAIQVLEHVACKSARMHLEAVSNGAPSAPETVYAQSACQRLQWRSGE